MFCTQMMMSVEPWWNGTDGKTEELDEKLVQLSLCPPQIPHGLTRARTRASAVAGRRLTAWAIARHSLVRYWKLNQLTREPGISISISSCYRLAGRPGDRSSIPGRGKGFFL
jgi:hypothetical protein